MLREPLKSKERISKKRTQRANRKRENHWNAMAQSAASELFRKAKLVNIIQLITLANNTRYYGKQAGNTNNWLLLQCGPVFGVYPMDSALCRSPERTGWLFDAATEKKCKCWKAARLRTSQWEALLKKRNCFAKYYPILSIEYYSNYFLNSKLAVLAKPNAFQWDFVSL